MDSWRKPSFMTEGPQGLHNGHSGLLDFSTPTTSLPIRTLLPLTLIIFYLLIFYFPFPRFVRHPFVLLSNLFEDQGSIRNLVKPLVPQRRPSRSLHWKQSGFVVLAVGEAGFWVIKICLNVQRWPLRSTDWQTWLQVTMAIHWTFLAVVTGFDRTQQFLAIPFFLYAFQAIFATINLVSPWLEWVAVGVAPHWATTSFLVTEGMHLAVSLTLVGISMSLPIEDPSDLERLGEDVTIEEYTTVWQFWTWRWVNPLVNIGTQRTLADEDIPLFSLTQRAEVAFGIFNRTTGRSIVTRILKMHLRDIFWDRTCKACAAILFLGHVYYTQKILESFELGTQVGRAQAIRYTILLMVVLETSTWGNGMHRWKLLTRKDVSHHGLVSGSTGELKDGKVAQAQTKGCKVSRTADLGKVQALFSGDIERIFAQINYTEVLVDGPITIPVAGFWLYQKLGWSAIVAVIVFILSVPLTSLFSKITVRVRRQLSEATDRRLSVINELIAHIKTVKLFGWSTKWAEIIEERREVELDRLWWRVMVEAAFYFATDMMNPAATVLTFLSFVYLEHGELTVSLAFTSILLFRRISIPLRTLPNTIVSLASTWVAVKRIQEFLDEEDVPAWATTMSLSGKTQSTVACTTTGIIHDDVTEIGFKNATIVWNQGRNDSNAKSPMHVDDVQDEFRLIDLNVAFPRGKISLVTGPTASGKSALLLSLLGEMTVLNGEIMMQKHNSSEGQQSVAYCGQQPWLQHMTIRENILFGKEMNVPRFNEVIQECALEHDLLVLEDGLETEVGVGGKTLSGGQQARIALARALYSDCNVILLDDPFSACDSHTCKILVERCLRGPLLVGRSCILVSHHVELITPAVDFLVRMVGGKIVETQTLDKCVSSLSNSNRREVKDKEDHTARRLIEKEKRHEGQVSGNTWLFYIAANSWMTWTATVVLLGTKELLRFADRVWLATWASAYMASVAPSRFVPDPRTHIGYYLGIYACVKFATALFDFLQDLNGFMGGLRASRAIHDRMLNSVIGSTIRWFDQTPAGRMCNRFSTDMTKIDDKLPGSFRIALWQGATTIGAICTACYFLPSFIPLALIFLCAYGTVARQYAATVLDVKRIRATRFSHIFQGYDETIQGIIVLRAYGVEQTHFDRMARDINNAYSCDYWMVLCNRWEMARINLISQTMIGCLCVLNLVWTNDTAVVAVTTASVMLLPQSIFALLRSVTALYELIDSVERVREYANLPQEPPAVIEGHRPPAYWPSDSDSGKPLLDIQDLHVRYAPELPDILKGVTVQIAAKSKIGVLGRTGSGKSSLAMSILRFVDPSAGSIVYDGIDITTIGVEDLRRQITYIPQAPCLFSGTLRKNLDIFSIFSDAEMLDVIEQVGINRLGDVEVPSLLAETSDDGSTSETLVGGERWTGKFDLDTQIAQDGKNVSAGQAQLIAMARAMLERKKLVIADEPTSNIDLPTDLLIQQTMRTQFLHSTLLVIAHRISSVIDYDKILVLSDGEVVEFDTPMNLLKREGSEFKAMCLHSGKFDELYAAAQEAEAVKLRKQ